MATGAQIAAMKMMLLTSLVFLVSAIIVITFSTLGGDGAAERGFATFNESKGRWKGPSSGCDDFFSGRWVYENSSDNYSLYSEKGCSFMSEIVACESFGRNDSRYRNWRWQPHTCDLPRFDKKALVEKLKGKRMAFVGDSLTWNQWVSMLCLLESAIPASHNSTFKPEGSIKALRVAEYNISIEHHWTPLLVESNGDDPVHNQFPHRIIRADSIEKHAKHWTDADFLVFDSYIWWRMPIIRLWSGGPLNDSINGVYKDVDSVRAFELTLKTWASWLESHVDTFKTKIFFISMSPSHFRAEDWGGEGDGNCYGETEPVLKHGYRWKDTDRRLEAAVEEVIGGLERKGVQVKLLNVTRLSEYRKDAHPSIYRQFWDTVSPEKRGDPVKYADCTHWCLPGVPDVWNHILYSFIVPDTDVRN